MITTMQRKELEKTKPRKYREKVKEYLLKNGHSFSLETIQKVYSGKRNNLTIANAIIMVFMDYDKQKKDILSKINNINKEEKK